jgi:hypothetical protein
MNVEMLRHALLDPLEEVHELLGRSRGSHSPITSLLFTSSAANSVVVPWRLTHGFYLRTPRMIAFATSPSAVASTISARHTASGCCGSRASLVTLAPTPTDVYQGFH